MSGSGGGRWEKDQHSWHLARRPTSPMAKIGRIIDAMRHERFRFKPVKRLHPEEERET